MTSEGLGEMFEGDSADTCAEKFLLVLMGGRAEGLACADPGARTPIGASGNMIVFSLQTDYNLRSLTSWYQIFNIHSSNRYLTFIFTLCWSNYHVYVAKNGRFK